MSVKRSMHVRDDSAYRLRWVLPRFALMVLLCAVLLMRIGFRHEDPVLSPTLLTTMEIIGLLGLTAIYGYAFVSRGDRFGWLRRHWREPTALVVALAAFLFGAPRLYVAVIVMLAIILFARIYVIYSDRLLRPGLLLVSSFVVLIGAGTLVLKLPAAVPPGETLSWVDALFTSTSAVCVTGLIVRDTATEFTTLGQIVILVLIQLGGLGIMLFGTLFAVMFGGSISLKQAKSIGDAVESSDLGVGGVERLVRFVVVSTLTIELVGALLVFWLHPDVIPAGGAEGQWTFQSVFLSISAFCNAGFAPFTRSLADYESRFTVHVIIGTLITLGGLGFPVLYNLWHVGFERARAFVADSNIFKRASRPSTHRTHVVRLNLHTKIVLVTSAVLVALGFIGIGIGQAGAALNGEDTGSASHIIANAGFMSVTARTAGFNSIDMTELAPASRYVLLVLMWIGGSPGSTAGGVKTVAIAVLLLSIWSTVRGRDQTEAFGRTIPFEVIRRAAVAASLGLIAVAGAAFALMLTEQPGNAESGLFEVVSASATVGLSLGMTESLSTAGKIIITASMFLGRIGPLAVISTIAFSATSSVIHARYHYPSEHVVIG